MSCLFCSIASHDIPGKIIYEDDQVVSFLDINPTSTGHCLIIPKKHADNFLEADPQMLQAVFAASQKVGKRLEEVLGCDGINVLSNVHEAAGQSVEHFHVHLIPRYNQKEKENLTLEFGPVENIDLDALYEKLRLD
jgi:histidine triad (HIT) family protein